MDNPLPVLSAPVSLEPSSSFRRSTSTPESLYEISYKKSDQVINTDLPLLNPYTAFHKPLMGPIKRIRTLIRQPASSALEYVQTSKFSQHPILGTQKEQFVLLQLPAEFPGQWTDRGYTYLHFGAIRLALTYHGRKGLPVTARMALLDTRYMEYQHAVIGTIETTLNAGTVFVTLFPNFCMSLRDPKVLSALQVQPQLCGATMESESIEATLHYQMAYRVQNHALDISLPNDSHDALLIVADYHSQKAPTCIHIPRQIPRTELLKLLPERWVTNYERIKHQTAPVAPIQSTSPSFIRNREGTVTIKFDRSQAKEPTIPPIFPTIFMVQPVPTKRKPDSLNKIIHSFDGYGNPTFLFRDPQSQHCYWDVGRCPTHCDCNDCEEPDYSRRRHRTSCQKESNLPDSDSDSDSDDDDSSRPPFKIQTKEKAMKRYQSDSPTIDTLGQPSGKFDYYVKYEVPEVKSTPIVPTGWEEEPMPVHQIQAWQEFTDLSKNSKRPLKPRQTVLPCYKPILKWQKKKASAHSSGTSQQAMPTQQLLIREDKLRRHPPVSVPHWKTPVHQ